MLQEGFDRCQVSRRPLGGVAEEGPVAVLSIVDLDAIQDAVFSFADEEIEIRLESLVAVGPVQPEEELGLRVLHEEGLPPGPLREESEAMGRLLRPAVVQGFHSRQVGRGFFVVEVL